MLICQILIASERGKKCIRNFDMLLSITKNFNVKLKIMLTLLEIVRILNVTGLHFVYMNKNGYIRVWVVYIYRKMVHICREWV
jgi:hypothetical protein